MTCKHELSVFCYAYEKVNDIHAWGELTVVQCSQTIVVKELNACMLVDVVIFA